MAAASPLHDRTSEFVYLSNTLWRIGGNAATPLQSQSNADPNAATPDRSVFNKKACYCWKLFREIYLTAVCGDLKKSLMNVTKQFQDVLTTRAKEIKAHEIWKQLFSTVVLRENPLKQPPKTVPLKHIFNSNFFLLIFSSHIRPITNGVQVGNQVIRRMAKDVNPPHQMEVSMVQQVVPRQENVCQSRAVALQNVESTIQNSVGFHTSGYGGCTARGAGYQVMIDDNVEQSLANGSLLIKMFLVLILFLAVFIFFVL
ncbi:hypothetical protein Pfo_015240 [Paulownia fortunei]|nr:hypothetical protein Pfo_015240 [Paulownia fortunei]